MKNMQRLLEELIERYKALAGRDDLTVEKNDEREQLRKLLRTGDMFIGYMTDKLNPNYTEVSLSKDLETMLEKGFYRENSGSSVNAQHLYMYSAVKVFNNMSDKEKENALAKTFYARSICQCEERFLRFIEPKWYKKIKDHKKAWTGCEVWDALMSVEDFDKITDEEIKEVFLSRSRDGDTSYSIACILFGEDRVLPLIAEHMKEQAKASETKLSLRIPERANFIVKMFKTFDDETAAKCYPINLSSSEFINLLCKEDKRYLVHLNTFVEDIANKIWEDSDYSDLVRYASIIAKCCNNRNIPTYQLNKIKIFAPLIQMYSYDYTKVFNAIKCSFNEDGSIKQETLSLGKAPKAPKVEQTYYCVIKDGNIQIFKSEEERTAANIQGGVSYDFNKIQLRKKMDELLGN